MPLTAREKGFGLSLNNNFNRDYHSEKKKKMERYFFLIQKFYAHDSLKRKKNLSIPSGKTNEITKLLTLITLHLPSRGLLFRFSNPLLHQGFFFHDFECFPFFFPRSDNACSSALIFGSKKKCPLWVSFFFFLSH